MALYKYVRKLWNKPRDSMPELMKQRLVQWRSEPATIRIERPTRIDRARSLGYRAKQGIFVVRQRVLRGGHRKPMPTSARRTRKHTTRKSLMMNYQTISEQRAIAHYPNCEVLNSYEVAKDGMHVWYEIIVVDVSHPAIKSDSTLNWMTNVRGRAFRGLTASAKKSRGLRWRGQGVEKIRPSLQANRRRRLDE